MKKKSVNIGKKLAFTKETIALLNMEQQQMIGGKGIPTVRDCPTFIGPTCATEQVPGGPCGLCPITD
ncbi:class I lanthipeptide [Chitinophaga qingshengii]|uniref:Class I lanthipeptide n=1 Tax=Chitinophaga qingshengii TaxID=1569794 RepID=A0ABR7TV72_9BACT|nr:class I lanthipeptide [Chitinophaga qingshengii]MBC9932859.1 class I lanthipeptide [Chitinophaga qingshengii]